MDRIQFQVKIFFLGAFAIICAGLWTYELYYVRPARACEAEGKWWYKPGHQCATPVKITDLTGRHMDDPDLTGPNAPAGPAPAPDAPSVAPQTPTTARN